MSSSLSEMIQRFEKVHGIEGLHYAATPRGTLSIGGGEIFSGPIADGRLYAFLSQEKRASFVARVPDSFCVSQDQARVAVGLQNFAPRFEK